jgi:maleate isomerase
MSKRILNGDGWRARIGIVVPSVNTVMEPWAHRTVPPGVSIFASRMFIPPATTPEAFIEMDRTDGKSAIRQLSSVFPDVIAYGCTASSIVQGLAYDAHLRAEIEEAYAVPATTAAHAILTATQTLGATAVSIISDGFRLAEPEPETLLELGLRGCNAKVDALIVSCLNTRSHTVIAALEQALGKPVITSTQATLWHALRLAGIKDSIPGFGRLLELH